MSGTEAAPGTSIGLPAQGRGSLASWGKRIGALIVDWGASMVLASAIFGPSVIRGGGWQMWMPMAVFFVESVLFTATAGGSFGQIVARVAVVRLDDLGPAGWWRAVVRTAMKCLVIPALVIGAERRGLDDLVLGTVVVNRK
ncbi:RDD family protein [Cutibacterium avidum]|uniref:RDD family protein n=1 Tax=Cutibacterium avidum TaxID=33010 RepID=UPI00083E7290|nr:RDD family protein [Cutibacterium avidum]AOG27757.1 RDD family protein [Cutibacterium avidum]